MTIFYYRSLNQHCEKLERPLINLELFATTSQAGSNLCASNYLFLYWTILLQHMGANINSSQLSYLDTELQHKYYIKDCFMVHMCSMLQMSE
jgi:hypothetical protein